ncbi:SDR family oxidoreductase [Lentilactobacillus kefiri]|uniref:SDR family oxidoreductase n=1 Tax=Lentilactobacillus kefiri TaxID=33962 RepID=UPI000BA678FA|nr:SDR family oxidoreductase [Lentilactobacillus kefiri]MCJ2162366.1 SDR family oxidoreductase [Lentilactobacillus kefiri]PAK82083.1 NAD(P)-dependent oxidoreductase [Lentilactobacillus kefiri]PAL05759.1 NAD(P)-dependent oxidoreductase [Lentilactobacillus kefiri]
MKYAVTGATGKFGQTVVKVLAENVDNADIIALARNTEKAEKLLPGIEARPGSYDSEEVLEKSLQGVDKLLLISSIPGQAVSRIQQHKNVINAAKKAGVRFIAYTSFPHADKAKSPLAVDHKNTEQAIRESGIGYSFLRNNWYLENERMQIPAAINNKPFVYSAGDGRVGWALEREYAEAAAKVLMSTEPKTVYEFSGPQHSYDDLARAMKVLTDNDFEVMSLSDDEYRKRLVAIGYNPQAAAGIVSMQKLIRDGDLAETSNDLPQALGHPLPTFEESLKEVIAKLKK